MKALKGAIIILNCIQKLNIILIGGSKVKQKNVFQLFTTNVLYYVGNTQMQKYVVDSTFHFVAKNAERFTFIFLLYLERQLTSHFRSFLC